MAQQVWHERIVANLECCHFQKRTELQEGQGSMKGRRRPAMPAPMKIGTPVVNAELHIIQVLIVKARYFLEFVFSC